MTEQPIRVLLVEDDESHAKLIQRSFRDTQGVYNVTLADSLHDARIKIFDTNPNIVICDLILPDGKGIELIPAKPKSSSYPVVVLTSQGNEQTAVEALKAGALDYVVKSHVVLSEMPRVVDRTLREWNHIVELKRAETNLQQTLQLARGILDSLPAQVAVLDKVGKIMTVNMAWSSFSASGALIGAHCATGTNYLEFCQADPNASGAELSTAIQDVIGGQEQKEALEHSCSVGEMERWFEVIIRPFTGAGLACVVVIHNEITHRKAAENEAIARADASGRLAMLTPREEQVMKLVVDGKPNKSIARTLNISVKTVEMHRSNMMKKLRLTSVPDLVRLALLANPQWNQS